MYLEVSDLTYGRNRLPIKIGPEVLDSKMKLGSARAALFLFVNQEGETVRDSSQIGKPRSLQEHPCRCCQHVFDVCKASGRPTQKMKAV
jgi:hypothetical protein